MSDEFDIWVPPNAVIRERATVPSVDPRGLALVRGYLKPRYVEQMADGRRVAELTQRDLDRVNDGYACGECLAYFDDRLGDCPSCGHQLDPSRDIVEYAPAHWQPSEGRTSTEILNG